MKSQRRLGLRPPTPHEKPRGNWGVAWFGHNTEYGDCARCLRPGRVYQGYNGGAHIDRFCANCRGPVLRDEL